MCSADIFLGVLAILFPPLPVWVKCGICSADSLINILLCLLGFIPGLLHAWYIIAKNPEPPYEYETIPESEGGRVAYVYVQNPHQQGQQQHGGMSYGTQHGGNGEGGSSGEPRASTTTPPSYAEVVGGDHKVQSSH